MTTGGRRRPDSRPSRLRCFFASRRVDPLMARTSSAGLCASRTWTTVSGGSSGDSTSPSAEPRRRLRRRRRPEAPPSPLRGIALAVGVGLRGGVVADAVVRTALAIDVVFGRSLAPATATGVAATAATAARFLAVIGPRGGRGATVGAVRLGYRASDVSALSAEQVVVRQQRRARGRCARGRGSCGCARPPSASAPAWSSAASPPCGLALPRVLRPAGRCRHRAPPCRRLPGHRSPGRWRAVALPARAAGTAPAAAGKAPRAPPALPARPAR